MFIYDRRIVVTRPVNQSEDFIRQILEAGGIPIIFPTIEIIPVKRGQKIGKTMAEWWIFTSINGAKYFLKNNTIGTQPKIAVVGPKIKECVEEMGFKVHFMPKRHTGEVLAKTFPEDNLRVLHVRGTLASTAMKKILVKNKNIHVMEYTVYTTQFLTKTEEQVKELVNKNVDCITFTSSSTVNAFHRICEKYGADFRNTKIVCIGSSTGETAEDLKYRNIEVAHQHTIDGMMDVLCKDE